MFFYGRRGNLLNSCIRLPRFARNDIYEISASLKHKQKTFATFAPLRLINQGLTLITLFSVAIISSVISQLFTWIDSVSCNSCASPINLGLRACCRVDK